MVIPVPDRMPTGAQHPLGQASGSMRAHRGRQPQIHPEAYVAPTALLTGDVHVAAGTAILDGAIITAESAPVHIGTESVVMEHAVVRGAGRHPCRVGDRTLIGPGAHVSGAVIGDECFVATHATVLNGAHLDAGVLVAIGAIVHVSTYLPEGARVWMQHIAVGNPAEIYPPERAAEAHRVVDRLGFTRAVFDHDTGDLDFRQAMDWLCRTYARALRRPGG
jgi:carbonic anhydrase/acetyltransferase-like protein (isoleucine patch superfamily)